jgi:tRNA pseudouridine38-40 synthase
MRFAIGLEYDGAAYLGWQAQAQSPTVQETVETALSKVANHPVRIVCAGRTDTGVHAQGQVAHFDSDAERSGRQWLLGCNSQLPDDIAILWARPVTDDFHARFSAFARTYRYVILNRAPRPALDHGRVGWYRETLDERAMDAAARQLVGEHDFSAFRSAGCQANHPVREVQEVRVVRAGNRVHVDITANGFLYKMVRNIVGSLIAVGRGEHSPPWIAELLAGRDRTAAAPTAKPGGLYFRGVRYPATFGLPEGPET